MSRTIVALAQRGLEAEAAAKADLKAAYESFMYAMAEDSMGPQGTVLQLATGTKDFGSFVPSQGA